MISLSDVTQAFLQSLMTLPRDTWDKYIDEFAVYLQEEFGHEEGDIKAEYEKQVEKLIMMVDSAEVDFLDVTGLSGDEARELSWRLRRWNGKGRVFTRRNGKRYLHKRIRKIDLANSFVRNLGCYDDLMSTLKDVIYYEAI